MVIIAILVKMVNIFMGKYIIYPLKFSGSTSPEVEPILQQNKLPHSNPPIGGNRLFPYAAILYMHSTSGEVERGISIA